MSTSQTTRDDSVQTSGRQSCAQWADEICESMRQTMEDNMRKFPPVLEPVKKAAAPPPPIPVDAPRRGL